MCPPDNGQAVTVCPAVNMGWNSNISQAGGSSNGGRSYEIMWDRDQNFSNMTQGQYMVVYRVLDSGPTRTLMPVRILCQNI